MKTYKVTLRPIGEVEIDVEAPNPHAAAKRAHEQYGSNSGKTFPTRVGAVGDQPCHGRCEGCGKHVLAGDVYAEDEELCLTCDDCLGLIS